MQGDDTGSNPNNPHERWWFRYGWIGGVRELGFRIHFIGIDDTICCDRSDVQEEKN